MMAFGLSLQMAPNFKELFIPPQIGDWIYDFVEDEWPDLVYYEDDGSVPEPEDWDAEIDADPAPPFFVSTVTY